MSRDIIRQHRNLSSDIAWGLYLVLAFISNPLRGTMSLVLTYNWRLFFCPHRRHSWFLPFSLNHLEPIPLWYQRLVKAWIFRATFQYSFDITSYVESQFPHRFFFRFLFLLLLHVCLVLSDQNLSFLHPHRDFLCIMSVNDVHFLTCSSLYLYRSENHFLSTWISIFFHTLLSYVCL